MPGQLILPERQQVTPIVVQQPMQNPNWYSGVAGEIGQFGDQVSALGVDLHRMKVQDELASAQIADADQYQQWRRSLDTNPDYASHLGEFEKFHTATAKKIMGGLTEPVARKAMDNYLKEQQIYRRNEVTIYARAKGGDQIEASMPEKIEALMRGVTNLSTTDQAGQQATLSGIQAGDTAARQYIDSFQANLKPDQIARWHRYREITRDKLDKEAGEANNKIAMENLFTAASHQGDVSSAMDLVNNLPAKIFRDEADRNQVLRRVQIHFNEVEARLEKERDTGRRDMMVKFYQGGLTTGDLDAALKGKVLDDGQYSTMMDALNKPKRATNQEILAGKVTMKEKVDQVHAGTVTPDQALQELVKYTDRFTSAELGGYVDEIMASREKWSKDEMDKAKRDLFIGVITGKIKDATQVDAAFKAGTLTDTEYQGLRKAITEPQKASPDDVIKAHMQVQVAINEVAQQRTTPEEATKLLVSVADKLSGAEGAKYFQDIQDAAKPDNFLKTPEVKRGHEFLDLLRTSKYLEQKFPDANPAQTWLELSDEYDAWAKANPKATAEEHQRHLAFLATPILMSYFQNLTPEATRSGIRRLPPEAQQDWMKTKGVSSDEWLEKWRKIKKPLTIDVARHYFRISGGNKTKAAEWAKEDNYVE